MTVPPIEYQWDGESLTPSTPFMARLADKHLVIGEAYRMVEDHARSAKTHNHYFASLQDAWRTLPEDLSEEFPTAEHLRKKALIRCGYADERSIVCASKAEALRVAAFIRPMDQYAIVVVSEATVKVYTAESQSKKAMGAKRFAESKSAVFEYLDRLLGVPVGATRQNAGRAA